MGSRRPYRSAKIAKLPSMTPCSVSLSHLGCQSSCAGASHPEGLFVSDDFFLSNL